jgi:hypothetical protein
MDWKKRLKGDELVLKNLIDRLNEPPKGGTPDERDLARRSLGEKLAEMNSYVEDCLSGRSDFEKSVLRYKLRIEYPLFAHLVSLSSMSREFVEFSCTA